MSTPLLWKQRDLDAAHAALAVLDQHGRIVQINDYCCKLIGDTRARLTGKNWFGLHSGERSHEEAEQTYRRVIAGEHGLTGQFETPTETLSAEGRIISWRLTALRNEDGSIDG